MISNKIYTTRFSVQNLDPCILGSNGTLWIFVYCLLDGMPILFFPKTYLTDIFEMWCRNVPGITLKYLVLTMFNKIGRVDSVSII